MFFDARFFVAFVRAKNANDNVDRDCNCVAALEFVCDVKTKMRRRLSTRATVAAAAAERSRRQFAVFFSLIFTFEGGGARRSLTSAFCAGARAHASERANVRASERVYKRCHRRAAQTD